MVTPGTAGLAQRFELNTKEIKLSVLKKYNPAACAINQF